MKSLTEIFPNASQSTVAANPQLSATSAGSGKQNFVQGNVNLRNVRRGKLNKTESEFAMILEAMKRKGDILRFEFEGITLRWADMRYTPDFVVFDNWGLNSTDSRRIKLIEVKGGHIWDRDIVRFKGARAYWPEFAFECHQKTKHGWMRKF